MKIGERIRAARKKRSFSQGKLANLLGVSAQAVSQWETDKNDISFANANHLANILGVDVMWILGDESSSPEEILLSPAEKALGGRIPVIDINNALMFYRFNVQRDGQFDEVKFLIEPTYEPQGQAFAALITDTSMTPEFYVGDLVVFDNAVVPKSGDFVLSALFMGGNEGQGHHITFRRYLYYAEPIFGTAHVKLEPCNSEFPETILNGSASGTHWGSGFVVATAVEKRRFLIRQDLSSSA